MQPQALALSLAALPAIAYAVPVLDRREEYSAFASSCRTLTLVEGGTAIQAKCSAGLPESGDGGSSGVIITTANAYPNNKLDLNRCIGTDDASGVLKWTAGGKFGDRCQKSSCSLNIDGSKVALTCLCSSQTGTGATVNSTINLNDGIANIEGQLVCNGGKADQWFGPL